MLNNRNVSTKTLSLISALVLSVPIALAFGLIEHNIIYAGITLFLAFITIYFLQLSLLENYINKKINLIYKFIHQTKATRKEEMYNKFLLPKKTLDDVTTEVEAWAEQYKTEMDQLQKNEQFRKEFLQNLSHEFKTPVFAIQGYIDTLLQGALENEIVNRRFLEKAAANTERLANLINDLDEISKLERGEIKLNKQFFVIQDVVREVFDTLSWKGEQKNIQFNINKQCEQPVTVYADKEKTRQVLNNLVDNAIKYGKYAGIVIASVYKTDAKNILVEITDDGMGIPDKQLKRVFERFYRTSEGRGRDNTGTGLGLSICKHIIEAHGHTIHVRSKEGVGTTIGFTLDARKEDKAVSSREALL
jgi:two-component system, OmpR family, phosphate regulon sensor histidine kinase PhoR